MVSNGVKSTILCPRRLIFSQCLWISSTFLCIFLTLIFYLDHTSHFALVQKFSYIFFCNAPQQVKIYLLSFLMILWAFGSHHYWSISLFVICFVSVSNKSMFASKTMSYHGSLTINHQHVMELTLPVPLDSVTSRNNFKVSEQKSKRHTYQILDLVHLGICQGIEECGLFIQPQKSDIQPDRCLFYR